MKKAVLYLTLISFIHLFFSCGNKENKIQPNIYETLKEGFSNPPSQARPRVYWWWMNGNVDTLRLKSELLSMKNAGIAGVDIFDIGLRPVDNPNNMVPAGPAFLGKESLQYIKYAVQEAGKLGIEVRISVSSSWNAGGSWIKPENAAKTLYSSKTIVNGSQRQKINLPYPRITPDKNGNIRQITYTSQGRPVYSKEVAVVAIPINSSPLDTAKIINLSGLFDAGKESLEWDVPEGKWEIYRYVYANSGEPLILPSPNSNGPIIDHFDSAATRTHLLYFINKLKPLLGDFKNTAFKGFYLASYEAADFTWTPSLPEEFKKLNGYELYKFIPSIFNQELYSSDIIKEFQFDYRKTLSELMIKNHYRQAKKICNEYGLTLTSEAGGPGGWHSIPVETLKALGSLDIPRGEFWYKSVVMDEGDSIDVKQVVKETAAASHIYKKGIVEMEAFTSHQHWQEGPFDLKPVGDRAFCEGMNRLVIHGFSHEAVQGHVPGTVYHAGTHFNDRNPWWSKIRPFNEYLSRISYILQKSDFVADVLYYNGDGVPNLVPPKNTRFRVEPGYDYEVINTEILLNELTVENDELKIPGVAKYKVLYIGENNSINPAVLYKLGKLAEAGAIIIGKKPENTIGLSNREESDKKVKALADKLWHPITSNNFNMAEIKSGEIYSGLSPIQVLQGLNIPADFSFEGDRQSWVLDGGKRSSILDYIHYKTDNLDFYLVRNTSDKWISRDCSFRQQDRIPEIWDPISGNVIPISIYNKTGKQIEVPITFAPYETYFVVFRKGDSSNHYTEVITSDQQSPLIRYTPKGFHFLQEGNFELRNGTRSLQIENNSEIVKLDGAWKLYFPKGWGAPDSISLPALVSWSEVPNEGVRYFSGIASYHKTFEFKRTSNSLEGYRVYLDLGDLAEIAEVWLNDQPLGITWAKPYRFDITEIIESGQNDLKVEVANTWKNRLIGDAKTGENYTTTNFTRGNPNLPRENYLTHNMGKAPWKELPLRESGLLGPVTIQVIKLFN